MKKSFLLISTLLAAGTLGAFAETYTITTVEGATTELKIAGSPATGSGSSATYKESVIQTYWGSTTYNTTITLSDKTTATKITTTASDTIVIASDISGFLGSWGSTDFSTPTLGNFQLDANLTITSGGRNNIMVFTGSWTGSGDLTFGTNNTADKGQTYVFLGDMSGYSGNITRPKVNDDSKVSFTAGLTGAATGIIQFGSVDADAPTAVVPTGYYTDASGNDTTTPKSVSGTGEIDTAGLLRYEYASGNTLTVGNSSIAAKLLDFTGGANYNVTANLEGKGEGSILRANAGTTKITGTVSKFESATITAGATLEFAGTSTVSTVENSGNFTLSGTNSEITTLSNLTSTSSATLSAGTVGTLENTGSVTVSGSAVISSALTSASGSSITVESTGTLDLSTASVTLNNLSIANSGTIVLGTGTLFVLDSAIVSNATETIDGQLTETRTYTLVTGTGDFDSSLEWKKLTNSNFQYENGLLSSRKEIDLTTAGVVKVWGKVADLTWNVAGDGTWDTTTKNWLNSGSADAFVANDNVIFATTDATITLGEALEAKNVTVNATTNFTATSADNSLKIHENLTLAGTLNLKGNATISTNTITGAGTISADSDFAGTISATTVSIGENNTITAGVNLSVETVSGAGTLGIAEKKTVSVSEGISTAISGAGTLDLSAGTTNASANSLFTGTISSTWTGTIDLGTVGAVNNFDPSAFVNGTESTVAIAGYSGYFKVYNHTVGEGSVKQNLYLTNDATLGYAISTTGGSSGALQHFSGKISGNGTIQMAWTNNGVGTGYLFSGDLSDYSGTIKTTLSGAQALLFGGTNSVYAVAGNVSGTGAISWSGTSSKEFDGTTFKGVVFNLKGTQTTTDGKTTTSEIVTVGNSSITAAYLTFMGGATYEFSGAITGNNTGSTSSNSLLNIAEKTILKLVGDNAAISGVKYDGAGTLDLGAKRFGNNVTVASTWTGTVSISGTVTNLNLSNYATSNSVVRLNGVKGYFSTNASKESRNFELVDVVNADGTVTYAFTNDKGWSSLHTTSTLTGTITGSGTWCGPSSATSGESWDFQGDLSGFSGTMKTTIELTEAKNNLTFTNATLTNSTTGKSATFVIDWAKSSKITTGEQHVTFDYSIDETFAGRFVAGEIFKKGTGTLTLTGSSSKLTGTDDATIYEAFAGTMEVSAGTLNLASTDALGSGTVTVKDGAKLGVATENVSLNTVTLEAGAKLFLSNALVEDEDASAGIAALSATPGDEITLQIITSSAITIADISSTALTADTDLSGFTADLDTELLQYTVQTWSYDGSVLSVKLAIPEPSMFGVIAGTLALALAGTRRRRRGK